MASYSIREYASADASETAYLATEARLLPTQRGAFTTRVSRIEFSQLWVSLVQESGARLKQLVTSPHRVHYGFAMDPDQRIVVDGRELPADGIACYPREGRCFERSLGPLQWCAVSLPAEAVVTVSGRELPFPVTTITRQAPPQAMEKLRQLCAETEVLIERQSELLALPEVVQSLEQALIVPLSQCLTDPQTNRVLPRHSARMIVDRFQRLIEQDSEQPLYLPEVCAAIRVPERTLRESCQKLLGMSPGRYLMMSRLNLAHRALCAANSGNTNVTEIATKFGFWHFGRFATTYRTQFGELPSATLKRNHR